MPSRLLRQRPQQHSQRQSSSSSSFYQSLAFLGLGCFNNGPYVIMLAAAKSISEGGVGLVYLANIVPGLLVKLSAPHWFHKVSYRRRLAAAAVLQATAFAIVAFFSNSSSSYGQSNNNDGIDNNHSDGGSKDSDPSSSSSLNATLALYGQLLGVAMISAQSSLGEASLLALAGRLDSSAASSASANADAIVVSDHVTDNDDNDNDESNFNPNRRRRHHYDHRPLVYFCAGTGLAGPFGYAWNVILHSWWDWSMPTTCLVALLCLTTLYHILASHVVIVADADAAAVVAMSADGFVHNENVACDCFHDDDRDGGGSDDNDNNNNVLMDDNNNNNNNTDKQQLPEEKGKSKGKSNNQRRRNDATSTAMSPDDNDDNERDEERHGLLATRRTATSSTTTTTSLSSRPNQQEGGGAHNNQHDAARDNDDYASFELQQLPVADMDLSQRIRLVMSLWPYMVPLFAVYAAEYACQGGAWTAMGFVNRQDGGGGLHDAAARNAFYETANWLYQVGVFVSRSSGHCVHGALPMSVLWTMPALQVLNLIFFTYIAAEGPSLLSFWYAPGPMYALALWTGLLGGAVYAHGYQRIVKDVPAAGGRQEFALAAVSVAESLGICVASGISLVLQSCLYQIHDIDGAIVSCPLS